jgi:hypothetical protein
MTGYNIGSSIQVLYPSLMQKRISIETRIAKKQ